MILHTLANLQSLTPNVKVLIDGILYPGTYLFVGAPKVGKSFMMAQLAYHVSTGKSLWESEVRQGKVLYLALEDDYSRLQKRLYRMFGTDDTNNLFFSVSAKNLNGGLLEQLEKFIDENPDTRLIIIDTLQKVRESGAEKFSYANDYEVIAQLKSFSDRHGICLLLVHHTRKQNAGDKFDMIQGTNGLLGAADGAFLLQKEKRTAKTATLDISGRGYFACELDIKAAKVGDFDTELIEEFFVAFTRESQITLHFKKLYGKNTHHVIEGVFKAFARTLKKAVAIDSSLNGEIPSTKGVL